MKSNLIDFLRIFTVNSKDWWCFVKLKITIKFINEIPQDTGLSCVIESDFISVKEYLYIIYVTKMHVWYFFCLFKKKIFTIVSSYQCFLSETIAREHTFYI